MVCGLHGVRSRGQGKVECLACNKEYRNYDQLIATECVPLVRADRSAADVTLPVAVSGVRYNSRPGRSVDRQRQRDQNRCLTRLRREEAQLREQGRGYDAALVAARIQALLERWANGFNSRTERAFERMDRREKAPYLVR